MGISANLASSPLSRSSICIVAVVVVGLTVATLHQRGVGRMTGSVPSEQPMGTFEAQLMTPTVSSTGLSRSGRWFTYDGRPIYLVGFDAQELACDPSVDYVAALDKFVQYRINKVRIWVYAYWRPDNFLHPWQYSRGRFNLDEWDPAYWRRVRDFAGAARSRKIIVEVTIFAPNNIDEASDWSRRSGASWNKSWNTNGAFSANAGAHFSPEFFDLNLPEVSTSARTLRDYQQALLDKAVTELGSFDNVYFEVANEFPVRNASIDRVYAWQLNWAKRLNSLTPRLISVHAHEYVGDHSRGIQYFWDEPYVDVLDFHFTSREPDRISSLLHAGQTRGKVLQTNEGGDPYSDLDAATRAAWGFFLSGGYYAMYEDKSSRIGSDEWIGGARRLKALRDIVERVRFWELSPVDAAGNEYDSLISQGPATKWQILAKPGSEYVAYFWGDKRTTSVRVSLPSGVYVYEWYDVRTARLVSSGSVSGAGVADIVSAAPAAWDENAGVALLIRRQ